MAQESAQKNKPLSGKELRDLIMNNMGRILDQDSMLASHIAYGRVAFEITAKIMTANPIIPNWSNKLKSLKSTPQQIDQDEALGAVETFPLVAQEGDEVSNFGIKVTRDIISPNASRIENDLPVPITYRGTDGDTKEESVKYDASMLPDENPFGDVVTERALTDEEISKEE